MDLCPSSPSKKLRQLFLSSKGRSTEGFILHIFMGGPIRVTRGRQIIKKAARSEETSSQLSMSGAEADKAD